MKFTNTTGAQAQTNSGPYKPLPKGDYDATIVAVDEVDFVRQGANDYDLYKGMNDGWAIQFRISDGQEGANRRFFERVWVHPEGADGEGNFPKGSNRNNGKQKRTDNWPFFRFANAVTDNKFTPMWNAKEPVDISREDLMGYPVKISLSSPVFDRYAFQRAGSPEGEEESYKTNNITAIRAVKGASAGGGRTVNTSAAVSLDEELEIEL